MSDRHLRIRRLITVLGVFALASAACGVDTVADRAPASTVPAGPSSVTSPGAEPAKRTQFGFGLSPSSYAGTDLPDFLDRIEGNTDVLMHAGDWGELDGTVFAVAGTLARQTGLGFVAVVSPNAAGDLIRPLDSATKERYLSSLRTFVAEQRPTFIDVLADQAETLGVELLVWAFVRADLVSEQPFRGMDLVS